jgi:uncharacterized repeat protein (TIGR03803 family)
MQPTNIVPRKKSSRRLAAVLMALMVCMISGSTLAQGDWASSRYKTVYKFSGSPNQTGPTSGLTSDSTGNLYGTIGDGGREGYGTVFELTPNGDGGWKEQVLYSFQVADGETPSAGLIFDSVGNLYGTTVYGGANGDGTVFELTPSGSGGWRERVLHSFGVTDGAYPHSGLIFDSAGNLYGTTVYGGANDYGTVFELMPKGDRWGENVLHSFGVTDGATPFAGLVFDSAGNLYGTTWDTLQGETGIVFELTPNGDGTWNETTIHRFCSRRGCADGASPYGGLVFDSVGNLYGTTTQGGADGFGTVFELAPNGTGGWNESVLHSFNGMGGAYPYAGLIIDAARNLYGTTVDGGARAAGTVFELKANGDGSWRHTILQSFGNDPGCEPYGALILDEQGSLFGTTSGDGTTTFGSVFEIAP